MAESGWRRGITPVTAHNSNRIAAHTNQMFFDNNEYSVKRKLTSRLGLSVFISAHQWLKTPNPDQQTRSKLTTYTH